MTAHSLVITLNLKGSNSPSKDREMGKMRFNKKAKIYAVYVRLILHTKTHSKNERIEKDIPCKL